MTERRQPTEAQLFRELEEVTGVQLEAARRGDLAGLARLFSRRQAALEGLQGRAVAPSRLACIRQQDAEVRGLLEARIRVVEQALQHLHNGGRALRGYATPGPGASGLVDERR